MPWTARVATDVCGRSTVHIPNRIVRFALPSLIVTAMSTARDIMLVLQAYFPPGADLTRTVYVLATVLSLWPLWRLHRRQIRDPGQRAHTGWSTSIFSSLRESCKGDHPPTAEGTLLDLGDPFPDDSAADLLTDFNIVYELLGIDPDSTAAVPPSLSAPPIILCTSRLECARCPETVTRRSLRRRVDSQDVRVLSADLRWMNAKLFISHCVNCRADYYPDFYTYPGANNTERLQTLELDAQYLRISKHGIWAQRRVALAQEQALICFHAGWSNFARWVNNLLPSPPFLTDRQSRRLFLEHFSRRLLVTHNQQVGFSLPAHSGPDVLAGHVRSIIGEDGGVLPDSRHHGCTECTRVKRYHADLIDEGLVPGEQPADAVAGLGHDVSVLMIVLLFIAYVVYMQDVDLEAPPAEEGIPPVPLPDGIPNAPPAQQEPIPGEPRGYVRMAVMDGKTITHRVSYILIIHTIF